jgi:signal recognition particle receptor subunit beta
MPKWNHKFDIENKKKIYEFLEIHNKKIIVVNSNKMLLHADNSTETVRQVLL